MSVIHTVVVGIDVSDNAKDAVDAARELVRLRHGHVHLVHVVPDVRNSPWTIEASVSTSRRFSAAGARTAKSGSPESQPNG
jgi:nucleotide-binding universal stress UspA family protein